MTDCEFAGVGSVSSPHWNNAQGSSGSLSLNDGTGTPCTLTDSSGTAHPTMATWNAAGIGMTPIKDLPGNMRMMKGYLDTADASTTVVAVDHIPEQFYKDLCSYDVYLYCDGNNSNTDWVGDYQISTDSTPAADGVPTNEVLVDGVLIDAAGLNFSGTYEDAYTSKPPNTGNYLWFSGLRADNFTVSATGGTDPNSPNGLPRAPLNGIQIVAGPPPGVGKCNI